MPDQTPDEQSADQATLDESSTAPDADSPAADSPAADSPGAQGADPTQDAPATGGTAAAESGAAASATKAAPLGWRRMLSDLVRPSRSQALLAVVLCLCALATTWTIRAKNQTDIYSQMTRADLVQMLDQLNSNASGLRTQITQMEQTKEQLQSGVNSDKVAAEQAGARLAELKILAGTAPAQGPGVTIRITDPEGKVTAAMLLDAVEEMRDAGAEVMDLNGVRIVASTWFGTDGNGALVVDGKPVVSPYVLTVIGDPQTLEEGARFRGGLVSQAQSPQVNAVVSITRATTLTILSLHTAKTPQFAQPTEP